MIRESGFVAKDITECRMSIRAFERSTSVQHFEDENTKGPPTIERHVSSGEEERRRGAKLTSRQQNCDLDH